MTRALGKRRARIAPELIAPLPSVADTLAMLDALATHQYETKARTRAALKLAHRALRDVLQEIEGYARYPDLISSSVAESLHRRLRRSADLDKPKRFPSLPRLRTPSPATTPAPEVATNLKPSRVAAPADRASDVREEDGTAVEKRERDGAEGEVDVALAESTGRAARRRRDLAAARVFAPAGHEADPQARALPTSWWPTTRPSIRAKGKKLTLIRKHIELLERIDAGEQPPIDPEVRRVLRMHVLISPLDLRRQRAEDPAGLFRLTFGVRDDIVAIRRAEARRRRRAATAADRQRQTELPFGMWSGAGDAAPPGRSVPIAPATGSHG